MTRKKDFLYIFRHLCITEEITNTEIYISVVVYWSVFSQAIIIIVIIVHFSWFLQLYYRHFSAWLWKRVVLADLLTHPPPHTSSSHFFNVIINSRMGGGGTKKPHFFSTMRNGGSYDEERSWVGCGRAGGAGEERNMGMRQESTVAQF